MVLFGNEEFILGQDPLPPEGATPFDNRIVTLSLRKKFRSLGVLFHLRPASWDFGGSMIGANFGRISELSLLDFKGECGTKGRIPKITGKIIFGTALSVRKFGNHINYPRGNLSEEYLY